MHELSATALLVAAQLAITSTVAAPARTQQANRGRISFGKLSCRGGLALSSPDWRLVGFSGL